MQLLSTFDVIPAEHIWINFDNGEGAALLSNIKDSPLPESDSIMALYVTRQPKADIQDIYLLTDLDIECTNCGGEDDECSSCDGEGTIWIELDDPSGISKDPTVLSQYFNPF